MSGISTTLNRTSTPEEIHRIAAEILHPPEATSLAQEMAHHDRVIFTVVRHPFTRLVVVVLLFSQF